MMRITFLFCVLWLVACAAQKFFFVDVALSWVEAQQFCRAIGSDLATVGSVEDLQELKRPASYTGPAWIGLRDDPASWKGTMTSDPNAWRWSSTGSTSPGAFHKWDKGEPNFVKAEQNCGVVAYGVWMDSDCQNELSFVCYSGSSQKQFHLIANTLSSWYDAQSYCRSQFTDLAVIENDTEHDEVVTLMNNDGLIHAWFGLYREPWTWSDNSSNLFTNWEPGQPDNNNIEEHCVAEGPAHTWSDYNCASKLPFFCKETMKQSQDLKMVFSSDIDLSDPETNKQILELLREKLQHLGVTNVQWKIPPKKQ